MQNLILYAVSYLLGSIPSGLILAKIFGHVDIKKEGSKSIGATNVLRVLKQKDPKLAKKLAILTVVCDVLKGVLPLMVASSLGASQSVLWTMAVLSVAGHCFSIFLGFQGGKGVATGAGVIAFLVVYKHIPNIVRLISGKEKKVV